MCLLAPKATVPVILPAFSLAKEAIGLRPREKELGTTVLSREGL